MTTARPFVDVHVHLAPDLAAGGLSLDLPSLPGPETGPPSLHDSAAALAYLDAAAIDAAWVSAPPAFYQQQLPDHHASLWIQALNDGLVARCHGTDRLWPVPYLQLEHPQLALRELDRHTDVAIAFTASAGGGSGALDRPELHDLWTQLAASRRPLLLHPGRTPDVRLDDHYLHNLLGNPVETSVAVAQLIFGGVLHSHPGLRVVLVHCGGVVGAVAGRWQRGVETKRPGVDTAVDVAAALRQVWVDTLAHDPDVVELARRRFGDDRLVVGSDWPFALGDHAPRSTLARTVSDDVVEQVGRANPAELMSGG